MSLVPTILLNVCESHHNGALSLVLSQVLAAPSPSAFPLLKAPNVHVQRLHYQ